ncbi:TIM44-like domain-containing protein [Aristophania vespae]|uniref:TIM44-like domain-containing protein n=1 Tax=Aristophania vespae TaxID=2697033 RepID=A0A6P1NFR8_9PROT|nr:TIM44-like domain-containing protein [Aristophania vespae]QHI95370.1 TIM44-like domain-containing protein [Aristophania vespae]UMM64644.1 hypothetical protein DM15PD_16610 [Aristophania vespae]
MGKFSCFFILGLLTVLLLIQSPYSLARAGRGSSFGSRGSHTWSSPSRTYSTPHWSAPIERSVTPRQPTIDTPHDTSTVERSHTRIIPKTTPILPRSHSHRTEPLDSPRQSDTETSNGTNSSAPEMLERFSITKAHRPSYADRHPVRAGFTGGFFGAGLFGLLSGDGLFGGFSNGWSVFGILTQFLVIIFFVTFVIEMRKGSDQSNAATQSLNAFKENLEQKLDMLLSIKFQDYITFQALLLNIQAAWSAQNLNAIRAMTTPEMAQYFNEQLADLANRGARNIVSNVQFLHGDLSETWREGRFTYATVAMRYSLFDVTIDSLGNVIDGSHTEPQTITELWTFVRTYRRGNWVLSAIQQAG